MSETEMKYIDSYRDGAAARGLLERVNRVAEEVGAVTLMEVCGTHTMSIFRTGLRSVLNKKVRLLSGPGCPVCVTPAETVAEAIAYSRLENVVIATFGDMLRVPGRGGSLETAKADGADVRIVYSPGDAVETAVKNPEKNVIFLGVGFETTSPTVASVIIRAAEMGLSNFAVLCAHKTVGPALEAIASHPKLSVGGLICPGHVSVITGTAPYEPIAGRYGIPCVIMGFEILDMLQGILMILEQKRDGRSEVEIQYTRLVRREGNGKARGIMEKVFKDADSIWRGLGMIPLSGFEIRDEYAGFDARKRWPVEVEEASDPTGCRCGEVLTGLIIPPECGLFSRVCSPQSPVGPCMVSSEGTCAAYYKYSD